MSNLRTNNTAHSLTLAETPRYPLFRRPAALHVDLILGVPATPQPQSRLDYSRSAVDTAVQLEYELARRTLKRTSG